MKLFLLTVATALFSIQATAQSFEFGINGGLSTATRPDGAVYQGENNVWTPAYDINFRYNFHERWQVGLAAGITSWERTGTWPLSAPIADTLGKQDVNFLIAKRALTFAFQFNHVIPFYQAYEDYVKSQLYFGVAAGPIIISNNGETTTSRVNPNTPAEYVYTSGYNFQAGYGFMVGIQLGYTYYLGERFGINIDIAPKMAWVETVDPRLGRINENYSLMYFPTTVGLHYRFGY